jgi:AcrR family transcriptional regulator
MSAVNKSTKVKILDAAEELFAEHGFTDTSLREITGKAQVNLASVNYHFGSKKSLIQAVFDRFFKLFHQKLEADLTALEGELLTVENVLKALLSPLDTLDKSQPGKTKIFMNLLGRAYSENQGHLRKFLQSEYGHLLALFIERLHSAYPKLPMQDLFWRLHFVLGAAIFTFAGHQALTDISASDFNKPVSVEQVKEYLLPFLVSGFSTSVS